MRSILRTFLVGAALAAATTVGATAQAQGLPLDRFDPSPVSDRMFGVPSPFVAGHLVPHIGLIFDYAHDPLVLKSIGNGQNDGAVIANDLFLHLNASLALWDRLLINVDIPVAVMQSGASPEVGSQVIASPNKAAFGDLRGGLRVRIFGDYDDPFQIGLGAYVWFPTGGSTGYTGDGHFRVEPQLLLGGRTDRVVWTLAGGPEFRATDQVGGITQGNQFNFGAGIGFLLGDDRHFQIGPEMFGALNFVGGQLPADSVARRTDLEILFDARYRVIDDLELGVGIGPGLTSGPGTPDVRVVASIAYTPEWKRSRPGDKDGDGILDADDACPDVKGEKNDDPKLNGCPPGDRDGDGILDRDDACPDDKGEKNDDPKLNGCPPADAPKPVKEPGDRDHDGIPDNEDACPDEKGPRDKDPEKNGCPRVRVTDKEIVITEQVQFDTAKATIKHESDDLLDNVAAVFKDHQEILLVEVQGYTDNTGSAGLNKSLSKRRADAVKAALIKRGIVAKRLRAEGFGPESPIADNSTPEGRQKNRRVQFKIVNKKP